MVSTRLLATLTALGCAACHPSDPLGNDSGGGGGGSRQLKTALGIDFTKVKGFVIAPVPNPPMANGVASFDSGTINQLFTLDADGSLTTVTVTTTVDGDGVSSTNTTSMVELPSALYDTRSFLLIAFSGVTYQDKNCSMVAARKADSALFCLTIDPPPNLGFDGAGLYYSQVDSDASGDFITMQTGGEVVLDFTATTGPTQTRIVDQVTDGMVTSTATNLGGDVLLSVGGNTRIYHRGAGFENHGSENDCYTTGVGADATNFYYVQSAVLNMGDSFYLHKLTATGSTYQDSVIYDDSAHLIGSVGCKAGNGSLVKSGTTIYQAAWRDLTYAAPRNYFAELVNTSGTLVRHTAAEIDTIQSLIGFDAGLVIIGLDPTGNSMMQRWVASADSYTTVLPPGEYAVRKTSVAASGEITFTGRRLSDNARILGTIAAGSTTVAIVPQTFAGDVVQIQRIN